MPSISDMFPSLDYDTLNRGLNFINFNLPSTFQQQQTQFLNPGFDSNKFNDGVPLQDSTGIEVTEKQLPVNEKEWDELTKSERIQRVMHEAPGMPIISQINLSLLRKTAERMDKKGMYKECFKLQKIADNFTKSITMNETETDGQHDENASVNLTVDKDGEPITINKTFNSGEEAMEFYNQFVLPGVEEVMEIESSINRFGFNKEAMTLRRFLRATKLLKKE